MRTNTRLSRTTFAVVALVLAAVSVWVQAPQPSEATGATTDSTTSTGRLLVTVEHPSDLGTVLDRAADRMPHAIKDTVRLTDRVARIRSAVAVQNRVAEGVRELPGVVAVEDDLLLQPLRDADDPYFPKQWAHQRSDTPTAWDTTTGSDQVLVAVVDTGMRGDHPDLRGNIAGQVDVSTGTRRDLNKSASTTTPATWGTAPGSPG